MFEAVPQGYPKYLGPSRTFFFFFPARDLINLLYSWKYPQTLFSINRTMYIQGKGQGER